jgi:hypothetical protein
MFTASCAQEMLSFFFTTDALYVLMCPISRPLTAQLLEQMVRWAASIQTCAPGSAILLLGSRCDEADDAALVPVRCEQLAACIAEELERQRWAQREQLAALQLMDAVDERSAKRLLQLQTVLSKPLQIAPSAIAVSASTLEGLDTVKEQLIEMAFNTALFPQFGKIFCL